MKETPDISVIIPFLNEEDNIANLSKELTRFVNDNSGLSFEFILVDDGSTDESVNKIKENTFPGGTRLIKLSRNFGSHAALRAGVANASGYHVTFIFADLQDPLDVVTQMHQKMEGGNDIVWAFRTEADNNFIDRKWSSVYSSLMKRYVNPSYPKNGFDIAMFNQKVVANLSQNAESNSSIFLQILNLGYKSTHIEYKKQKRNFGKSKWTFGKKVKLMIDSFVAFSFAPIRFVSVVGISFFIAGVTASLYLIIRKIVLNDLTSGWPALVTILLLGFGITNISLGIIAEYLWRTLDASRKRPVFLIDEIIEVNPVK